ncbi:unnamed protein product [Parnassius apollo]|uniref:Peptidoglycan recognition protein n=1 Tax=Parnassius apollo TaxID=110799 RepID=A0A8S3X7I0_PARAO|nr:unnamed protein product [Parnassius apollo]
MKRDSNDKNHLGLKVEGDLGDLQIIKEVSDDDCESCDEEKFSRAVSNLPNPAVDSIVKPSTVSVFGTVEVTNSENVQFGNNTYFYGPVTVIQAKTGTENASYTKTEEENVPSNQFQPSTKFDAPIKKQEMLTWHKWSFFALGVAVIGGICALIIVLRTKTEESYSSSPASSSTKILNTTVVRLHCNSYTVFIITSILLPIILLLMFFYSLLTKVVTNVESIEHNTKRIRTNETIEAHDMCTYDTAKADPLLIAPDHLRIVSRTDWLAQPVEAVLDKIVQPVPWVIITHTATESCSTQSQCVLRVRLIQTYHIESRGWYDIGYNFLVGGDGSVYYGRGWDYIGAHTKGYNKYSIAIAFIGTFNNEEPPKQQVDACKKIIEQGVTLGKLKKDYKLFAHRHLMSTLSPGDKLFNIIKDWPHFVKNITNVDDLIPKGY